MNEHANKAAKRPRVFEKGVLPFLAIIVIGFAAMGAAIFYESMKEERLHNEQRPPIPTTYHAFVPEDPVIGPVLARPSLDPNAPYARPKDDVLVPVGYGGDKPLSSAPCQVSHEGHFTQLGAYDERSDGEIEGVIAVYMAPAHSFAGVGECASKLVFMIQPEYRLFG